LRGGLGVGDDDERLFAPLDGDDERIEFDDLGGSGVLRFVFVVGEQRGRGEREKSDEAELGACRSESGKIHGKREWKIVGCRGARRAMTHPADERGLRQTAAEATVR
jgi:hypothetical protein